MTDRNVFEAEARHAKVRALTRRIDRDLHREDYPKLIAFLKSPKCDDAWWTECAKQAGLIGKSGKVLTPSTLTRDCVIAEYVARAEEDAHRDPSPELSEAVDEAFNGLETDAGWAEYDEQRHS